MSLCWINFSGPGHIRTGISALGAPLHMLHCGSHMDAASGRSTCFLFMLWTSIAILQRSERFQQLLLLLGLHEHRQCTSPSSFMREALLPQVTNSSIFWKILDVVLALSQSRDTKPSVSRRDPKEHGACHWACSGNAMQMGRTEGVPRQSCNVPQQLRLQPGTGLLQP